MIHVTSLQHPVDVGADLEWTIWNRLASVDELGGVRVAADGGHAHRARAGDDEAARHHGVAGLLGDRVGLAR